MTKIPSLLLGLLFTNGTGVIVPMEADYLTIENQQVEECPCCHTKLSENQNGPLCILECKHSYHTDCLKEHLDPSNDSDNQENTCLSCKKTISADFIRKNKLHQTSTYTPLSGNHLQGVPSPAIVIIEEFIKDIYG